MKNKFLFLTVLSVLFVSKVAFAAEPAIINTTNLSPDGSYVTSSCLNWHMELDQYIEVVPGEDFPSIEIILGGNLREAHLSSYNSPGSGEPPQIVFAYCIQEDDATMSNLTLLSPIVLNGSTIQNSLGENLVLDFIPTDNTGIQVNPTHPTIEEAYPEGLNDIDVFTSTHVYFQFSENIFAGDGNVYIYESEGGLVESIPSNSDQIEGLGTDIIIIDLAENLDFETYYYVLIDSGAFEDIDGDPFGGINDELLLTFRTLEIMEGKINASLSNNLSEGQPTATLSVGLSEPIIGDFILDIFFGSSSPDVTLSTNQITYLDTEWNEEKTLQISVGEGFDFENTEDYYIEYSVQTGAEYYREYTSIVPVVLEVLPEEPEPETNTSRSSKSSSILFSCNDMSALNYSKFGRHNQALCRYDVTQKDAVTSGQAPIKSIVVSIKPGDNGEFTRQWQQALLDRGYTPGPLDGLWGPRTKQAIIQFQKDKGLAPDGWPGVNTVQAMRG
jgi:hypothetical protein